MRLWNTSWPTREIKRPEEMNRFRGRGPCFGLQASLCPTSAHLLRFLRLHIEHRYTLLSACARKCLCCSCHLAAWCYTRRLSVTKQRPVKRKGTAREQFGLEKCSCLKFEHGPNEVYGLLLKRAQTSLKEVRLP